VSTEARITQPLSPLMARNMATLTVLAGRTAHGLSLSISPGATVRVGRSDVELPLMEDPEVSPVHASFAFRDGQLMVTDHQSLNGVWLRIREPVPLQPGDRIRAGSQYFTFEPVPSQDRFPDAAGTMLFTSPRRKGSFRVAQIMQGGYEGLATTSSQDDLSIGGDGCTISFSADPFLSQRHARIFRAPDGAWLLTDHQSTNGTWVAIRGESVLRNGDMVCIGGTIVRVAIQG
jgi:pSer/pThr/pTyr-binding forkhead associated (FHA) protein